jgi:TonB family protein
MALSDFMPYGAPELLEGASPRMARSTFTATGLVAAIVCCIGIVVANRPVARERVIEFPPDVFNPDRFQVQQPPRSDPRPVAVHYEPIGNFKPGPEDMPEQPVIVEPPSSGPVTPGTDDGSDVARGPGNDPVTLDPDPLPNVYVYTDELPQLVRRVTPIYPDIAREAGVEGTVRLQLLIGLDGRVQKAIVQPKGSVPMLDQAAITAALASVFTPALVNNRPVKVWVTQDYRFKLR